MNRKTNDELLALVHKATEGDKKAYGIGEVPIGCVIVYEIGRAHV